MLQTILIPRRLSPKSIKIAEPKSLMLYKQVQKEEPKKLLFAAGAGSVPPPGGNDPSVYNNISPELLKKCLLKIGNSNNLKKLYSNTYNKY